MKFIPASEAKTHFGELLDTAQREPVTVSKQGRPVAVMMSIHDYEEMKLARLRAHLGLRAPIFRLATGVCRKANTSFFIA